MVCSLRQRKAARQARRVASDNPRTKGIATYKKNLVLGNLVTRLNHQGQKGDTLHIPKPTRGAASAKAANAAVTIIQNVESEIQVSIASHYEYSRLIEDIVSVQGLDSLRQFYTDDAGNALAERIDTDLHLLGEGLQTGTTTDKAYDKGYIGSDGSTLYTDGANNAAALADDGIRRSIQRLDDVDVPQSNRYLVIPPIERNNIMGLARFTEQAFVGETGAQNTIRSGIIGNVYGVEVFVSTNCTTTKTSSNRACLLLHKSALLLVMQMGIRVQTQYKQEYLSDLLTADTLYGKAELRNDGGVALIVPGS